MSSTPKVPYIDLKAEYQALRSEIEPVVQKVLASGSYILGSELQSFEQEAAGFLGSHFVAGVGSGTDAVEFALRAVGVQPGDEVVVPAMTYVATAEAVVHAGARPVFCDIDPDYYTMGTAQVEAALTPKVKAILPVHLYGQPCTMKTLTELCKSKGLLVVEDCAQAIGAMEGTQQVGSFGAGGAFSFFPTKNLGAYGDGGMVATQDPKHDEHVRMMRMHGSIKRDDHLFSGRSGRLDEIQAAILRIKLRHLNDWNQKRYEIAQLYHRMFEDKLCPKVKGVKLPKERDGIKHVYHIYALRVPKRNQLVKHLNQQGIGALVHYSRPVHLQPAFSSSGLNAGDLPNAEALAAEVISLPIYPGMSDGLVEQVVDSIVGFYTG